MLYRREKRDRLWLEKKQENKRRKIKRRARKATLQTGTDFYFSLEWRRLRFDVIMERGRVCDACGAAPKNKSRIHVDHIKPRSKYPELELKKENLQILCDDCNIGKGARYEVDFRELN
jgi:5-methylcytosine-specific restriction endonuclease McrA